MSQPEAFPIPVKKCPQSHHKFVTYLYNLVHCLTGNANFPAPTPTVAEIEDAADGLAMANAKARNGSPADTADRNARRADAEALVDQLVSHVKVIIRANASDPASAANIILSSGLSVRKRTTPNKAQLAAKYGLVSGEVLLEARAIGKVAIYLWEYSLDQTQWKSLPQTLRADTSLAGLTPGRVYYFRFRAQTPKGLGDYSQVVSLMVH